MSSRNSSGTAPWAAGSAVEGRRPAGAVGMPGTPRSCLGTQGEALQVPRAAFMMLLSMAWVPPQGPQEQGSPWRSAEMGTSFPCEILNWLFLVPGDCPVQTSQAGRLGAALIVGTQNALPTFSPSACLGTQGWPGPSAELQMHVPASSSHAGGPQQVCQGVQRG